MSGDYATGTAVEAGGASSRVDRRRARTRREILDAAWRLAERDGIAGLSLREVAREVGMRAPSLYAYVDGKSGLYDAMFAEGWRQQTAVTSTLDDQLDRGMPPRDVLVLGTKAFLRFCQASIARYQLLYTRAVPDWRPSPEAYAVSQRAYAQMAATFARIGIRDQRRLDLWTALGAGLAAQQLANDPHGDRWYALIEDAVDMFLASGPPLQNDRPEEGPA